MTFAEWCEDLDALALLYGIDNVGSLERFRTDYQGGLTPQRVLDEHLLPRTDEAWLRKARR